MDLAADFGTQRIWEDKFSEWSKRDCNKLWPRRQKRLRSFNRGQV